MNKKLILFSVLIISMLAFMPGMALAFDVPATTVEFNEDYYDSSSDLLKIHHLLGDTTDLYDYPDDPRAAAVAQMEQMFIGFLQTYGSYGQFWTSVGVGKPMVDIEDGFFNFESGTTYGVKINLAGLNPTDHQVTVLQYITDFQTYQDQDPSDLEGMMAALFSNPTPISATVENGSYSFEYTHSGADTSEARVVCFATYISETDSPTPSPLPSPTPDRVKNTIILENGGQGAYLQSGNDIVKAINGQADQKVSGTPTIYFEPGIKDNHNFIGFELEHDQENALIPTINEPADGETAYNFKIPSGSDGIEYTITALWEEIIIPEPVVEEPIVDEEIKYHLTFSDVGTGGSTDIMVEAGSQVMAMAGSKTDYTFSEWTMQIAASGIVVSDFDILLADSSFVMPASDVHLTVNWLDNSLLLDQGAPTGSLNIPGHVNPQTGIPSMPDFNFNFQVHCPAIIKEEEMD